MQRRDICRADRVRLNHSFEKKFWPKENFNEKRIDVASTSDAFAAA
jgi:hypothetical protein